MTAMKSVSSARPLRNSKPSGFCMKPLAMRIHTAERLLARATSQAVTAWALGESLSQPKCHTPMKVDSRKKAAVASMAKSEPKISPT
jgi:hypothetical protein